MKELGKYDRLSEKDYLILTFEKVLKWFESMDIRTDIGRISVYKKYIEFYDGPPKNEIIPPIERANLNRELFELIWIYESFIDFKSDNLKKHVKSTLKGVVNSNLEDVKDHSPRNYLFELRVASYFLRAGYEIELDSDCDLIASKNGFKYYVECKRLNAKDKISRRIKEASKQLNKRLNNDKNNKSFGIIWIDLSFVQLNYTGFYSAYYRRSSQTAARIDLMNLLEENTPKLSNDKRVIGLIGQTFYPAITAVPEGMYVGSTISLISLTNNFFKKRRFRKMISEILKKFG